MGAVKEPQRKAQPPADIELGAPKAVRPGIVVGEECAARADEAAHKGQTDHAAVAVSREYQIRT